MTKEKALQIMATTKSTYQLVGKEFSDTRDRIWPEMQELVKKYVKAGDRVLDVGCGNGRLIEVLPETDYWGIDSSATLLQSLKFKVKSEKLRKINIRELDILELDKLDQEFDIVFCFASFNHVPPFAEASGGKASEDIRVKILRDIKKLLKPEGLLIMTNWNMWQLVQKKSVWRYKLPWLFNKKSAAKNKELVISDWKLGILNFKDVMTVWQSGDGQKKGEMYYRAFTKGELAGLFKKSGFKILENYLSENKRNIVSVGRN